MMEATADRRTTQGNAGEVNAIIQGTSADLMQLAIGEVPILSRGLPRFATGTLPVGQWVRILNEAQVSWTTENSLPV